MKTALDALFNNVHKLLKYTIHLESKSATGSISIGGQKMTPKWVDVVRTELQYMGIWTDHIRRAMFYPVTLDGDMISLTDNAPKEFKDGVIWLNDKLLDILNLYRTMMYMKLQELEGFDKETNLEAQAIRAWSDGIMLSFDKMIFWTAIIKTQLTNVK